jgi:hypothetical protein
MYNASRFQSWEDSTTQVDPLYSGFVDCWLTVCSDGVERYLCEHNMHSICPSLLCETRQPDWRHTMRPIEGSRSYESYSVLVLLTRDKRAATTKWACLGVQDVPGTLGEVRVLLCC